MPTDDRSMRDDADHRRVTHERWVMMRVRKQGAADYRNEWYAEQCGRCRFWIPLSGTRGLDYGACSNATSPLDRQVAFEHDGCDAFEDAGAWQVP